MAGAGTRPKVLKHRRGENGQPDQVLAGARKISNSEDSCAHLFGMASLSRYAMRDHSAHQGGIDRARAWLSRKIVVSLVSSMSY